MQGSLTVEDIDHTRAEVRSPQTNKISERFPKTEQLAAPDHQRLFPFRVNFSGECRTISQPVETLGKSRCKPPCEHPLPRFFPAGGGSPDSHLLGFLLCLFAGCLSSA